MKHRKIVEKGFGGQLTIELNYEQGIFLVTPSGIINPSLVKRDIEYATEFSKNYGKPWVYIVDTEKVIFANPLNLYFLRKVKDIQLLRQYIIYTPSKVVQVMTKLLSPFIKVDRVIKRREELKGLLKA